MMKKKVNWKFPKPTMKTLKNSVKSYQDDLTTGKFFKEESVYYKLTSVDGKVRI
jgi:hypothetical protein